MDMALGAPIAKQAALQAGAGQGSGSRASCSPSVVLRLYRRRL